MIVALGIRAIAQDTPSTASAPQRFVLNLPEGVSLISAPLDTGQTIAQNQFLGLPPDYSSFYGWNPDTQQWVPGLQVPARIGGGYWIYLSSPATLVVEGQPYGYFAAVTDHIAPGWHLFGVPFQEGIGWKDFHLFASGNPISLDTAMAMGWIDSNVLTTQGNQFQYQAPGQPLLPGVAYWVHTTVPLDLRAEREAAVTPATSNASGQAGAQASSLSGESTSTSTMGWLAAVCGFLEKLAEGAAQFAEGNWAAFGADVAGGTFGLIDYALEEGSSPTSQLSQMDAQLDTLIGDVGALQSQSVQTNNGIQGLQTWLNNQALSTAISNADSWLNSNVQEHDNSQRSREWARWQLAGCNNQNPLPSTCPEADTNPTGPNAVVNTVNSADLTAFQNTYITNRGTPTSTGDFPLFWAESVIGTFSIPAWDDPNGVDVLEGAIYTGLTANMGAQSNGLMAYMEQIFLSRPECVNDVSASTCDLYELVYIPLEQYFQHAIADQAQLVEAQVEADGVLAQELGSAYQGNANLVINKSNKYLNGEAEAFLEVAEQLALYRAADGTMDWNNFGSSDAGQILARADFLVMQLAGNNYGQPVEPGFYAAPWPSSGVVGRVFYVNGEPVLSGTRAVCPDTSQTFAVGQASCASPVAQLSENASSNRSVTGDWPYLQWQTSSGTAAGTSTNQWTVQRLQPATLATGSYLVNSTTAARLGANLFVGNYDSSYDNLPAPATGSITFGSLNGIEGAIGKYGLPLGESPWTTSGPTTTNKCCGLTSPSPFQVSFSTSDVTDAPGGAFLDAAYPVMPVPIGDQGYSTEFQVSWSATSDIKLAALPTGFTHQHVHWPTTVNVNLNGGVTATYADDGSIIGGSVYYSSLAMSQQLLAGNSQEASAANSSCTSSFNTCTIAGAQSIDAGSLALTAGTQYTFRASFSSAVLPYSQSAFTSNYTYRSSNNNSAATWVIDAPVVTLTKQ